MGRATGFDATERVRRVEAAPPIAQTGNIIRIGDTNDDPTTAATLPSATSSWCPRTRESTRRLARAARRLGVWTAPVRAQTGSGSIRIERAGGSLHAQTGSGNIQADSVGGEVRAQTGSGSVEVRQIARADVTVQTGSGSVTLNLPPDAAYTLNAQTGSGSISTSQPLTGQGTVKRNHVTGTVRGGGSTSARSEPAPDR